MIGWAGIDYPSVNGWTYESMKTIGVFDFFRNPKFGAFAYKAQVHAFSLELSFYWDLDAGSPYNVRLLGKEAMIWSDAEVVELRIDGVPFASLQPARHDPRFSSLPNPPFIADFTTYNHTGGNAELEQPPFHRVMGGTFERNTKQPSLVHRH